MSRGRGDDFPAVRIEAENEWAWCGERRLTLAPRTFAVLRHLVEHPQRLITKDQLLAAVWGDTVVSDAALTSCIRDLRSALADSSRAPRYIQTVHRRGFRFIGPIAPPPPSPPAASAGARRRVPMAAPAAAAISTLVGREAELARLHERFQEAMQGRRQLVFVTGEPGIGKTSLVETFLAQLDAVEGVQVGHGQCVQQYGAGEAYLPVLEALGRLGRGADGQRIVHVLKQHAPTWLAQLPALVTDHDLEVVQRRAQGATRERMLRELVEGLDALTVDSTLVLVLEDLHWSDSATIDLLAMLARRQEASRLLVVATYRPADVAIADHPLKTAKQELELHGRCEELALEFLSVQAVTDYLAGRFGQPGWAAELAPMLHRRTDGNPLFLVNTVDGLLARGQLRQEADQWVVAAPVKDLATEAPESLGQMVERQFDRLTLEEQAMLAVASVAGVEFSAALAAADGIGVQEGERRCEALARRGQFLRPTGTAEWPDGTVAGRYAFIHALYRHVLYGQVPAGRRVGLHLRIAERLEQAYGQRAGEIAGELAAHFTEGRDVPRAASYHGQAAEAALRQHGYREAADHLTRALELLRALPITQERVQHELTLHVMLGSALAPLKGHAAREVEETYARARELSEHVVDTPRLFPVLLGLGWFYLLRGSLDAAREVGQRLSAMAETDGDTAVRLASHNALGLVAFYGGELPAALSRLDRGIELYDQDAHSPTRSPAFRLILDPGVSCAVYAAWILWMLGYPARSAARMRQAMALAGSIVHPFTLAHAHRFAASFHHARRERAAVLEQADSSMAIATEHGFGPIVVAAGFHRGWVIAEQGRPDEGLASMRAWVAACREIRSECLLPAYLAWLGEACGRAGRTREGLELVDEGLATATRSGNHYWTAELHRVRGELAGSEQEAESSLLEAITVARRQSAKSLELRAVTSLARLWVRQGKTRDARAVLGAVYDWFTEGLDTPDLVEARTVLGQLERAGAVAASSRSDPRRRPGPKPRVPNPKPGRAHRRA